MCGGDRTVSKEDPKKPVWWGTPTIPTLERQTQEHPGVHGQPELYKEF